MTFRAPPCIYNVTSTRVHISIVAIEKQKLLHILSVCLYCCTFSAPYYILVCELYRCAIFFYIISYTARFSEKGLYYKICFAFLFNLETFLVLRIINQDIIINAYRLSCKVPVFLVRCQ